MVMDANLGGRRERDRETGKEGRGEERILKMSKEQRQKSDFSGCSI